MAGFGEAVAHGAVTIINAISIGRGAALGIDLWTKARVQLTNEPNVIKGSIISEPSEDTALMRESVLRVLEYFQSKEEFGAEVETESNIPIAKGLKSSSVAANALALATVAALGRKANDLTAISLGVDAAVRAKTTITGAFDDACASFFGNIIVTNNLRRKILRRFKVKEGLLVLIHVPDKKSYTYSSDVNRMKLIASQVEAALCEALTGNYWTALTMNGILYSAALGYDPKISVDALAAGAIASGLSGKGPATVAVVQENIADGVVDAWHQYGGRIIRARVNQEKARILRRE